MDEKTKQIVARVKSQNQAKIDANLVSIAEYEAIIAKLEGENVTLEAENTVLAVDVPEPTIIEPKE